MAALFSLLPFRFPLRFQLACECLESGLPKIGVAVPRIIRLMRSGELRMRIREEAVLASLSISLILVLVGRWSLPADGAEPTTVRALLVLGGCCHDYKSQQHIITKGVSARANVQWVIAYDPDTGTRHLNPWYEKPDWAKGFDVVVHDECCSDVNDLATVERILKPHRDGLPAVILHCGVHSYRTAGYPKTTAWFEFTGLASTGHGPQVPIEISFLDPQDPITRVLQNWKTGNEELYNNSSGRLLDTARPLAHGHQTWKTDKGEEKSTTAVCVWTNKYQGKTNVFATTLGHNNATVADDRYLDLISRGLLWSVGKLDSTYLKPASNVLIEDK